MDVAIRTIVAGEPLLIAIECRKKSRKSDVEEVGAFASKLEDIAAHKGIMVSAKGFSKTARRLATAKGISLYRYEDTLSHGWPSGLETSVIVRIWELYPTAAFMRHSDGSLTDIHQDEDHEYFDSSSGIEVSLATLVRKFWDMVPKNEKCNGDHCYEHPVSTPDDHSVVSLGLAFKSFRHMAIRIGRLQFEGLVNDESSVAKVIGWKMVFPDAETAKALQDSTAPGSALSLQLCSTFVRTDIAKTEEQIKLFLFGHLEVTVGSSEVQALSFSAPHSKLS